MEKYLRWLRACPSCGRMLGPVDGFCGSCWKDLLVQIPSECWAVPGLPFQALSLMQWTSEYQAAGDLVRSLKGEHSKRSYRILAQELIKRVPGTPGVMIVPPSKSGRPDHAWNFASELSALTGRELESPFGFAGKVEQKSKGRRERLRLSFALKRRPKTEAFIFIDDLITTGATALAAWRALGKPKMFSAWTVACRPLRNQL